MNSLKPSKDIHNPKYKTSLCKYINTAQGCPFKSKCLFAHSEKELRPIAQNGSPHSSSQTYLANKSKQNYKTTKCKNYEKNGTCRFGERCTFAHGDAELRKVNDNNEQKQTTIHNTKCNTNSNNDINMTVQQQGFGMLPGKKVRKEDIEGNEVKDCNAENDKTK